MAVGLGVRVGVAVFVGTAVAVGVDVGLGVLVDVGEGGGAKVEQADDITSRMSSVSDSRDVRVLFSIFPPPICVKIFAMSCYDR